MLNTPCPDCGSLKNPNARQCKSCANETRRQKCRGVRHTDERRRKISEAKRRHAADGRTFDLAAYMRDKPHPNAKPIGHERTNEIGRVSVKCPDGKYRWRARVNYEAAYGPIPAGYVIHHKDGTKDNDAPENLQAVTRAEHARIHRP